VDINTELKIKDVLAQVVNPKKSSPRDQQRFLEETEEYLIHQKALGLLDKKGWLEDALTESLLTEEGQLKIKLAIKQSDYELLGQIAFNGIMGYLEDAVRDGRADFA
jgi:hypothetical protein